MPQFFAVQTTPNQERTVIDEIVTSDSVHAAVVPPGMNSYVIVEAETLSTVEKLTNTIFHAKKVLPGETSIYEVREFLDPQSTIESLTEAETVEIISEPYKGDKAKIQQLNYEDETVTVELEDTPIPIPIELNGDQVRQLTSNN